LNPSLNMAQQDEKKKKCGGCCSMSTLAFIGVLLALYPVYRTFMVGDDLSYMYPNFLLFTGFRQEAIAAWKKVLKVDTNVKVHHTHIPEVQAKDYSFETLRHATNNFRHPAVVRGLFADTPGVQKWAEPGYLNSKIGKFTLPVVNNAAYGTMQNDRSVRSFGEAYDEVLADENSKLYLFFPVKSRFTFNASAPTTGHEELQEAVNKLTLEDLKLDQKIREGFGTSSHKTYVGSQIIIGRGSNTSDATTGTGWHCAGGNNYFVQVVGHKKWYFMDPEYSAVMSPLRGGMVNMMTGNKEMAKLHDHIPLKYADIHAGDLLYNPDWEWHTIKNYEGLSIGCPIRELNILHTFRNNFQYTSIILINKLLDALGAPSIGGYPAA